MKKREPRSEAYERLIRTGETPIIAKNLEDALQQRDALWEEDRRHGTETPAEAAYRARIHAVASGSHAHIPCDRCGVSPSLTRVLLAGSPGWILKMADHVRWTVAKRWAIEQRRS